MQCPCASSNPILSAHMVILITRLKAFTKQSLVHVCGSMQDVMSNVLQEQVQIFSSKCSCARYNHIGGM